MLVVKEEAHLCLSDSITGVNGIERHSLRQDLYLPSHFDSQAIHVYQGRYGDHIFLPIRYY